MKATRAGDLVPAGVIVALISYFGCRLLYGNLPPLPALAGITLLVLAIGETALGFSLRARIQGKSRKRVNALTAARSVALAKASSLLGSIMVGLWLGVLGYVLPASSRVDAAKHDVPAAIVGAVCAAALIGAALWLEHCCRTPDDPYPEDPRSTT